MTINAERQRNKRVEHVEDEDEPHGAHNLVVQVGAGGHVGLARPIPNQLKAIADHDGRGQALRKEAFDGSKAGLVQRVESGLFKGFRVQVVFQISGNCRLFSVKKGNMKIEKTHNLLPIKYLTLIKKITLYYL